MPAYASFPLPLRIHVLSDLHVDAGDFVVPALDCDVVVVAGDLTNGKHLPKALQALGKQVKLPLIYVPGNHDWYDRDIGRESLTDISTMLPLTTKPRRALPDHLHLLDDAIWRFDHHGTTYRFIGSTWWSAMDWTYDGWHGQAAVERVQIVAGSQINDYRAIAMNGRTLTPADTCARHHQSTAFIQQQLAQAKAAQEVPIVITHFLPSRKSCHPRFANEVTNAYFANQRDDLTVGVPLWIHGHTHDSFDYLLPTGCRVVCNPRGYYNENAAFQPSLIVEVPGHSTPIRPD